MIRNWRKATHSVDNSSCVETGWADGIVGYRDTKHAELPEGERPTLLFSETAAATFLTMIRSKTR